ncbi:MAG: hypothetical protein K8R36_07470, partial [Planctomycetales bacterium]|nr:hypothetical protein [Planctomycetales bacterium]
FCLFLGSFAWWRDRAERQRKVVEELRLAGAIVEYRYYSPRGGTGTDGALLPEDEFLPFRVLRGHFGFGDDYLGEVDSVVMTSTFGGETSTHKALELLQSCPKVRHLSFQATGVKGAELAPLPFIAVLERLEIWSGSESSRGFLTDDDLAILDRATQLKWLALEGQPITDSGIEHLCSHSQLRELSLKDTMITDAGLQHLGELRELTSLNLSYTGITDIGLKHLGKLNQIHILDLSNTRVEGTGILQLDGLRGYVRLDGCPVSDEVLPGMGFPMSLAGISFAKTKITDKGFCKLRLSNSISQISLTGTAITDASLDHLLKYPRLSFVYVVSTQVTPAGIKRFKSHNPKCLVYD